MFEKYDLSKNCPTTTSRTGENIDLQPQEKKFMQKIIREVVKDEEGKEFTYQIEGNLHGRVNAELARPDQNEGVVSHLQNIQKFLKSHKN